MPEELILIQIQKALLVQPPRFINVLLQNERYFNYECYQRPMELTELIRKNIKIFADEYWLDHFFNNNLCSSKNLFFRVHFFVWTLLNISQMMQAYFCVRIRRSSPSTRNALVIALSDDSFSVWDMEMKGNEK